MTVDLVRAPHLWARALAATVLVMTGATAAHTWAGGHLPALPGLLALAGVVLGASVVALRGSLTWRLLLPLVAVAQAGLHGMFGLLGSSAEHAAHAVPAGSVDPAQWSWQMLAAHAAGTLLTALAWWLCDRAVVALVVALRLRTPYVVRRRPLVSASALAAPSGPVLLLVAPRRGPPVAAVGA